MPPEAQMEADFYLSARGGVTARLLRARLSRLWPDCAGQSVLGIGYALPYLRLWRETATRCIALMPPQVGVAGWPAGAPGLSCIGQGDALPLPDLSFDRVLLVHGLETADSGRAMLREVWRVLKDDGRLIIVAANRRGMWAQLESTPFGQGRPYSAGQLDRLLAKALFCVERRDTALFVPPVQLRLMLRSAPAWDAVGRSVLPGFAGVTITEAVKDLYAAVPIAAPARRRLVFADAA